MKVRLFSLGAFALTGISMLSACGRAGGNGTLPGPGLTQVQIALKAPAVPAAARRRAKFIAPSVQSGTFSVNGGTPAIAPLVAGAPGCVTTTSGLTCTVTLTVPFGNDTIRVALYDAANATGALLGTGTATATIAPGPMTTVGITIGGVVASVNLALGTTAPPGGTTTTIPLTVTALDADGNIIIADPFATPITLTDSDTSGATQLSTASLASPAQAVNVTYSGVLLANATFSAAVTGATIAVQSAVLTPKTASTTDWSTFGFNPQRTGYNPNEAQCCTSAPALIWSRTLAHKYLTAEPIFASNIFTPLVAGGAYVDLLFVADNHSDLYALNAATGAIVWQKELGEQHIQGCSDMPDNFFGITGTPLFDRASNRLYVVDGAGKLWAFDPATGSTATGWPAGGLNVVTTPTLDHVYSALNLDSVHGIIPVPTASYCDSGHWTGALRFVNVNSATVASTFIFGQNGEWGSGMWGMDGTAIDASTGDIFGASGNAEPSEVSLYSDSLLRWTTGTFAIAASSESTNNIVDDDYGAGPSLFPAPDGSQCTGAENKSGVLFVYEADQIAAGTTASPQLGAPSSDDFNSATPTYSPLTGMIYITTGFTGGPQPPGLYAYAVLSSCRLGPAPTWSQAIGTTNILSPTTIANGVVFVADGRNVYGFNAATGAQLWTLTDGISSVYAGMTVANGMLFVANWDGSVTAYAAPGAQALGGARR